MNSDTGKKAGLTVAEILQKMQHYCTYQDRCHYEVEQKMREFYLAEDAKDEIMLRLIQDQFLNEERFTRSFIRGKFYQKSWGRNKIKQHLIQKKISDKLIRSCMNEILAEDYWNTLTKLYSKLWENLIGSGLQAYQKKIKIARSLMAKGYEYDLIQEVSSDFN